MNEWVIFLVQLSFFHLLILVSDSNIEILLPVCDDDLCTKSFIYLYLSNRISPVSIPVYTCTWKKKNPGMAKTFAVNIIKFWFHFGYLLFKLYRKIYTGVWTLFIEHYGNFCGFGGWVDPWNAYYDAYYCQYLWTTAQLIDMQLNFVFQTLIFRTLHICRYIKMSRKFNLHILHLWILKSFLSFEISNKLLKLEQGSTALLFLSSGQSYL